jgi:hypothetical protein
VSIYLVELSSIGAEEPLLPAVGVDTEKAGELHAVRRYASLAVRPTRPETFNLSLKLRRTHA